MSHEIYNDDGLALAGKKAWHGLGIVLPDTFSPDEGLKIAGLEWTVVRTPLALPDGTIVPTHVANVRSDTQRILGVVGDDYSILQNADLAHTVAALANGPDPAKVESCGSLRHGVNVFFLARLESLRGSDTWPSNG